MMSQEQPQPDPVLVTARQLRRRWKLKSVWQTGRILRQWKQAGLIHPVMGGRSTCYNLEEVLAVWRDRWK